jgi:eukaryotic-like serine/threonine-protein kinase
VTDVVGVVLEGRYRVEAALGRAHAGGTVYRGRDTETGASVVVRCPAVPADLPEPEAALAAFVAEAELLAHVGRAMTDVERLLASGVADVGGATLPYCVFEWLAGRSLEEDRMGRPPLSVGEALVILEPAARALSAAHDVGASHRDVRPKNLWISDADGRTRLKVAAFPLAIRIGPGEDPFAPEYGAPEHFKKSYGAVGAATDVYGLALVLVELLSGKRALEGRDDAELYLATSDLAKRPTARARGAEVSDALDAVLARALAVDPRRRWANVRELWDALYEAVPEMTPSPPSVRPDRSDRSDRSDRDAAPLSDRRLASVPPGIVSRPAPVLTSTPPPSAVSDARLPEPSRAPSPPRPPETREASQTSWAWPVVLVLSVLAIGIVVAKVGKAPAPAPVVPKAAAPKAAPPRKEETAVMLQPFLTDMVKVPAGAFAMGSDREGKGERPRHEVRLTRAFYIDRTETPAQAYSACVEDGACTPNAVHLGELVDSTYGCNTAKERPRHPANCVDRQQAEKFCAWAGKRLPSEAEWEYAARGTDEREYPWGNAAPTTCATAILTGMTGACGDRKGTWEIGTTAEGKSPYGALDMAGNVWEWVDDGYQDYTTEAGAAATDPRVPLAPGSKGVLRGGSWDYSVTSAKVTYRLPFQATSGNVSTGFRCARDAAD